MGGARERRGWGGRDERREETRVRVQRKARRKRGRERGKTNKPAAMIVQAKGCSKFLFVVTCRRPDG